MQNWHFVVIKRKDLIGKIADAVLKRNEEICLAAEAADATEDTKKSADRFRKFVRNFTVFFTGAPVLIVVLAQTYEPSGYREMSMGWANEATLTQLIDKTSPGMQSVGAAVEHLMLRAIDLGYGGCWLTSANYAADLIEDIVAAETDFDGPLKRSAPDDPLAWFMVSLVSIGVPEDGAKSPGRKPIEEIMTTVR
jgi:nitroreductase